MSDARQSSFASSLAYCLCRAELALVATFLIAASAAWAGEADVVADGSISAVGLRVVPLAGVSPGEAHGFTSFGTNPGIPTASIGGVGTS